MSQPFPSSGLQRRGLTPVTTSSNNNNNSYRSNQSVESPQRSAFPPITSQPNSQAPQSQSTARQNISRTSSISSNNSPFDNPTRGLQQQPGQLLSSLRARNIPSANNSHLGSSSAALPAAYNAPGPTSGGGGPTRLARGSPSLSQSSNVSSPIVGSNVTSIPAGGQQSLNKIVVAQIFLLLSGLNSEKDKAKRDSTMEQVTTLVGQHDAEVFAKFFRRLITNNASYIFAPPGRSAEPSGSYPILQGEMRKVRQESRQAIAVADALNTTEGDTFRDLDVATLLEHFKFDDVGKYAFGIYLKSSPKADLRVKADNLVTKTFPAFISAISHPNDHTEDVSIPYLTDLLDRILQDPPKGWSDEARQSLFVAVIQRYDKLNTSIPREVLSTMHLADLLSSTSPLVRLIHRTGPRATSSLEACKDVLANAEIRDINYTQVASVLLYMVIAQKGQAYSPSIFVAALREHRSGKRLDWQDVVHAFDREGLVVTKTQFLRIYSALLPLAQEYENFDIQLLWGGNWQYVETQLSFVVAFLSCTTEELDALAIPRLRKTATADMFDDAPADVKALALDAVKHPLVSLDAVEALFRIVFASQDAYAQATRLGIPETVINPHTDYFVLSVAAVPKPWGPVQEQAFKQLFTPFLRKQIPGDRFVFHGMWKRDPRWLNARLIDAFQASPLMLECIFQHAIEHGWLESLLQTPSQFSVDLAALAHAEGQLDIDTWLSQTHQALPEVFPRALVEFIDQKAQMEQRLARNADMSPTGVPLAVKTVVAFLQFLQPHLLDEHLIPLLRVCINAFPRIINYGEGFDSIIDENGRSGNQMTQEADTNMQEHFKRMYNKESDVRSIVESLRQFKQSEDPAEQDLFACMIVGLFDEYHCFPEYPQEALATTAVLFGSIINFNLLSSIPLQAGLAMVLEAVQGHTGDTKMFKFGLEALTNFRSRLHEWPAFCERLLQVPELQTTELWSIITNAVRGNAAPEEQNGHVSSRSGEGQDHGNLPNGAGGDFDAAETSVPVFTCLFADPPLRPELYEDPDEDVRDKVLFILNNVSARNLSEKLKTLKETLEQKHHQWFAAYLVDERAKLQPNFQPLYLDMLENFSDRNLWSEVLRETYRACVDILNAPSTKESSMERGNMKNLAGWLGSLTLARDKPIKYRNICFRDLLIEAHHTSRLIVAIPFTCKVLVQAARSKVFKPPNPWTMEIVNVLVELYLFGGADMKLQLKFEVEVLCKDLNLDIEAMKLDPSTFVRDSLSMIHEDQTLVAHTELPEGLDGFGDLSMGMARPRTVNDRFSAQSILEQIPEDLASRIQYPPFQTPGMDQDTMRTLFTAAARNSIHEIIVPVVERSVTIAAIATTQLVTKDYATEPDIEKLRKAAQNLVGKLAGSLADVTCKEPLRMSMTNNLRNLSRDASSEQMAEGVVIMFVNDNIEMACRVIQHAAEEAAAQEIESLLQDGIRTRQAHAAMHAEEPFCWPDVSKYAYAISEPFRPASYGGLKAEQLAIYENFQAVRTISNHLSTPSADNRPLNEMMQDQFTSVNALPAPETPNMLRQGLAQPRLAPAQGFDGGAQQAQLNGFSDPSHLSHRIDALLEDLGRAMKDAPEEHVADLARDSPTRVEFEQLLHFIDASSVHRDSICGIVAHKAFAALYSDLERRLEVEVLVQLLANMASISPQTAQQLDMWVANLEEARLLKPAVTPCLVMAGLLAPQRLDHTIANAMRQHKPFAIEFFAEMVNDLLPPDGPLLLRSDFAQSLEVLTELATEASDATAERAILAKLELEVPAKTEQAKDSQVEQLEHIFEEWVQLTRQDVSSKMRTTFIGQIHRQELLDGREPTTQFLRVCLELSIDKYEHEEMNPIGGTIDAAYTHVDALAQLIMTLTLHHNAPSATTFAHKAKYLDYLLSLVVIIQSHHQQTRAEAFNQKIFFRLYAGLLCQTAGPETTEETRSQLMTVFGSAFLALQPMFFPSFTFAWLSLISHRFFLPVMMQDEGNGQRTMVSLLGALFAFIHDGNRHNLPAPILRAVQAAAIHLLLLVQHDFPTFLADNHAELLIGLPSSCPQIRNLIISAAPATILEMPDPFSDILEIEPTGDLRQAPTVNWDYAAVLKQARIQRVLDDAVTSGGQDISAISHLCEGMQGNLTRTQAVALSIASKSPMEPYKAAALIREIIEQLTVEGRNDFVRAMVDQLRYPNSHTLLYSTAIAQLFAPDADTARDVKTLIARVLLEGLLIHRPHAWGIVATFFLLYKTVEPQFWEQCFNGVTTESPHDILNSALSGARRDWRLGHSY